MTSTPTALAALPTFQVLSRVDLQVAAGGFKDSWKIGQGLRYVRVPHRRCGMHSRCRRRDRRRFRKRHIFRASPRQYFGSDHALTAKRVKLSCYPAQSSRPRAPDVPTHKFRPAGYSKLVTDHPSVQRISNCFSSTEERRTKAHWTWYRSR